MTTDPYVRIERDLDTLAETTAQRQAAGDRIVFTNGVFDLLHIGHVDYLRRARALGDWLVVGLNSDASTVRLKGPLRPLVGQDERAALLAALLPVDVVTIFENDTASDLLARLRPDLYVKGADYATASAPDGGRDYHIAPDDLRRIVAGQEPLDPSLAGLTGLTARLPEAVTVAEYGGALALLAYLPGHSTSALIERIVSRYTRTDVPGQGR